VEIDEGSDLRLAEAGHGNGQLPSARMRGASRNRERAAPGVERDRADEPTGREGVVNGEPSLLAEIGRELSHEDIAGRSPLRPPPTEEIRDVDQSFMFAGTSAFDLQ
jgi:hypothetical protein